MNSDTLNGIGIGLGIGWLNATLLGVPAWAHVLIMSGIILVSGMTHRVQTGGHSV